MSQYIVYPIFLTYDNLKFNSALILAHAFNVETNFRLNILESLGNLYCSWLYYTQFIQDYCWLN